MSTRKFFPAQAKVFPRAVFNPSRVGLYIPSKPRAVIETQGIKPPSEKKIFSVTFLSRKIVLDTLRRRSKTSKRKHFTEKKTTLGKENGFFPWGSFYLFSFPRELLFLTFFWLYVLLEEGGRGWDKHFS